MHCIGIFANPHKPDAPAEVQAAITSAEQKGYHCVLDAALQHLPGLGGYPGFDTCPPGILVALGGDGTILRAAALAVSLDIPVLGINFGRIGFLSEISAGDFAGALEAIEAGRYTLDARMMLRCSVNGGEAHHCLNEALLYKRHFSGVADINVTIGAQDAGNVFCDGIIISTPTGATGYSISAGGPVIAPGLDAFIITPICPHTLSFRPIIASDAATMRFSMRSDGYLAMDGMYTQDVNAEDIITVCRSEYNAKFIRLRESNLYALIQNKLT
ncbi:MAG: NAD(+)/NADH kinase [Christensenellaceae bacterium]|jgi:NAD+ kinase|nr:NAD(+)/NADH kinase [Christensenellaceae bacterium]